MKTSGPVLAVTLFAIATAGYAGIASAGPHGGAAGFRATGGGPFGISGPGLMRSGIMGTGRGIMGTGRGIMGTGVHSITHTGDLRTSAVRNSERY